MGRSIEAVIAENARAYCEGFYTLKGATYFSMEELSKEFSNDQIAAELDSFKTERSAWELVEDKVSRIYCSYGLQG